MQILIVNFYLDGITEAEYYRLCDQVAPAFAEVPGLVSKVWLADKKTNTYGGVYTFSSRKTLDAFLGSDLFREVGQTPGLADISVRDFGVLEGPTRITHGAVPSAA